MPDRVLIVDDEPAITAALMTRMEVAGYDVFHAINGLAGLEAAELHRPDVIVLDIRMPDIEGFEVCARLKQHPDLAHVPVIFLSANVQDSAKARALNVGGFEFLSKPYESADVLAAVARALDHASPSLERSA
jgi:CheY-like chemotaxis protein